VNDSVEAVGAVRRIDDEQFWHETAAVSRQRIDRLQDHPENVVEVGVVRQRIVLHAVLQEVEFVTCQLTTDRTGMAVEFIAVVTEMSGGQCKKAEIVLGAAAPVPMRAVDAARILKGKSINESVAGAAGEASMKGATPLSGNAYKVPIFKTIVKRAILKSV